MKKCKLRSLLLAPLSLLAPALVSKPIEIGAQIPAVTVLDESGNTIDLAKVLSKGYGLIFFYPRSFTPGCTAQACSLRDAWSELSDLGVKTFGVSSDSVERQAAFRAKHNLPFGLLADTDQVVSEAFGSPAFSRQAFLFKDGVLVWRDLRASTRNQAEDVLTALEQLAK